MEDRPQLKFPHCSTFILLIMHCRFFAVYKAVCKRSNEVVVLKSYQLSAICELYQHQIFREVGLHASLAHENVVQLTAAFQARITVLAN